MKIEVQGARGAPLLTGDVGAIPCKTPQLFVPVAWAEGVACNLLLGLRTETPAYTKP